MAARETHTPRNVTVGLAQCLLLVLALALLALTVVVGGRKTRLVAETRLLTREVVFTAPQTLAVALATTSTYNLSALRFTVKTVALGYTSDPPIITIERIIDPPYTSGPIAAIESDWWQLEWEGVEGELMQLNDPGWPDGAAWDELEASFTAHAAALNGIDGCWVNDSCPAVIDVVSVFARGSPNDLQAVTASPLVQEVRF
jgi:hypothetical protein